VRTCRYLLRRAATPTVKRSAKTPLSSQLVTKRHDSASELRRAAEGTVELGRGGESRAQRGRLDEVRKRGLAVDLDDGEMLPVPRLEIGVAGDVDELELETELVAGQAYDLERALAEVAVRRVVERDLRVARYG
jgi:hypothetical protein